MDYLVTIIVAVLTGGFGSGVMSIILAVLQRRWNKNDGQEEKLNALVDGQKLMMLDRVKHLGKRYIEKGEISFEDKESVIEMHNAYKKLGGNGHLDMVMAEIEKLKVV